MEKIELTKDEKRLLKYLISEKSMTNISKSDEKWLYVLEQKKIIGTNKSDSGILRAYISEFGEAYCTFNPNLNNPSMWDDKKYIINTAISAIALIISLIAIFKD